MYLPGRAFTPSHGTYAIYTWPELFQSRPLQDNKAAAKTKSKTHAAEAILTCRPTQICRRQHDTRQAGGSAVRLTEISDRGAGRPIRPASGRATGRVSDVSLRREFV